MTTESPTPAETQDDVVGARYPNTARIWNYMLGGKDNFAVDREAAETGNAMSRRLGVPTGTDAAVEGRHLLQRMVDYMLGQGVRQFLDLGSGLPNMANTHQIAHRADPRARVVYVDLDAVVSSHAAALMAGSNVLTLKADLREPDQVLHDHQVRDLIDFDRPVGVMFMCVLHCLWDWEDPWAIVRSFRDAVVPGSHLAISHMTDEAHPEGAKRLSQLAQDMHFSTPLIARSRADIERFFEGFTLVAPGLVPPAHWRPDLFRPLLADSAGDDGGTAMVGGSPGDDDRGVAWHLCGIGTKD
jgi:SAM-dependent methyltransferase